MKELFEETIKELFNLDVDVSFSRPDERFGDYSTNISMQISKQIGKNPREISEAIVARLRENDIFEELSVAGPGFINIIVSPKYLADKLSSEWTNRYGENNDGEGKTVVVEYPSPNMAKPYSIGHLRPANQGWAAKRLMDVCGWNVITDNHLGDYGAPFGIWVVGFLKFSNEEALKRDGVYELGRVYIETKKALKEEKNRGGSVLADSVQDWLIRLENNDEVAKAYSKKFNEISLHHIHHVMKRMKISTDYELGESFFVPKGKKIVQEMIESGIAIRNDDGSVIVPLDEFGIDVPFLILKSNGTSLYATNDIAAYLYRQEKWSPDRFIYATGNEQIFYFNQLFSTIKKMGSKTELLHLWFGVIDQISEDGKREKMSSRKGVVLMEELLDMAEKKARNLVEGRDVSDTDIEKISLGAIKFSDFTSDRRTNILFDWSTIFALTGFSGPYVQYAAVRVNKIIHDNEDEKTVSYDDYSYTYEKSVLAKILEYPDVIRKSARDLEPHKIAMYIYELAKVMNRYYEKTPITVGEVTEAEKAARLDLLKKVSHVFAHGLSVLGIEVPERM